MLGLTVGVVLDFVKIDPETVVLTESSLLYPVEAVLTFSKYKLLDYNYVFFNSSVSFQTVGSLVNLRWYRNEFVSKIDLKVPKIIFCNLTL